MADRVVWAVIGPLRGLSGHPLTATAKEGR